MRRTYYAFAIHWLSRPLVRFGVPLIVLTYVIAKLVFVAKVVANAQSVGMAKLPEFTLAALLNADTLTLVTACVFVLVVLAAVRHVMMYSFTPERSFA